MKTVLIRRIEYWVIVLCLVLNVECYADPLDRCHHGLTGTEGTVAVDVSTIDGLIAEFSLNPAKICIWKNAIPALITVAGIDDVRDMQTLPKIRFSPNGKFLVVTFQAGEGASVLQVYDIRRQVRVYEGLHLGYDWLSDGRLVLVPQSKFGNLPGVGGVTLMDLTTSVSWVTCKSIFFLGAVRSRGTKLLAHVLDRNGNIERPMLAIVDLPKCAIRFEYPQEVEWLGKN